ncbi:UDP-N-acetylmuramoyl-tripeptide--D-alanyl-D-alanine ligase [Hydrogenothermus marinus]|uniref:UDP-N-acetylmuramoyl-tripeptide--D-alanyl-D-alanine ligase n=1 Tax=Hydrogenothermus marinus TaxID=133270 RepID=A0A3M0BTJ3_9AQUI|nr:UDP-N-acetylmuramoyl-tripeptide--D-alanyl-D-alanine ligase [Hydrogenothermus marinus]RMA97865.1 UDP-N-acetylmuramoyl-tripeptide--D-alanyl-D-alanine ligase [Hydrogenothermus marinus]
MKISQIAEITEAKVINLKDKDINRFIINSKETQEGDFFVPLKGTKTDGHNFIEDALKKGAYGSFSIKDLNLDNILLVDNPLKALTKIAKYNKQKIKTKIAITGTAGKTTTKEILSFLLSQFEDIYYTKGNYNNHIGLPLTLANIDKNYNYGIFELGASQKGDIEYLSDILNQDIAVITNVGYGHTEGFGGYEGVLEEKTKILNNAKFKIIPEYININDKNTKSFGYKNADILIKDINLTMEGTEGILSYKGENIKVFVPVFNKKILENVAISVLILDYLGFDYKNALKRLNEFTVLKGRGNIIKHKNLTIIDDTYNANPISTKNAIETLSNLKGRKILVLADMKELGKFSKEKHEEIGRYILNSDIDKIFLFGEEVKYIYDILKEKKDVFILPKEKIAEKIKEEKQPAFVWIKGSRSTKMEEVIDLITE